MYAWRKYEFIPPKLFAAAKPWRLANASAPKILDESLMVGISSLGWYIKLGWMRGGEKKKSFRSFLRFIYSALTKSGRVWFVLLKELWPEKHLLTKQNSCPQ